METTLAVNEAQPAKHRLGVYKARSDFHFPVSNSADVKAEIFTLSLGGRSSALLFYSQPKIKRGGGGGNLWEIDQG